MSLILKPLLKPQFSCLTKIFQARIIESGMQERTTVEDALATLEKGYNHRFMGAYVDDFVNPKHCLIMSHFPGIASAGAMAHISLIYSVPEERGNPHNLAVMLQTAYNYAVLNGARTVVGTSWLYRGSKGSDAMWIDNGFEIQETTYVKHI